VFACTGIRCHCWWRWHSLVLAFTSVGVGVGWRVYWCAFVAFVVVVVGVRLHWHSLSLLVALAFTSVSIH
jgi:hypothetical protein